MMRLLFALPLLLLPGLIVADPASDGEAKARKAMATFKMPPGFTASLFASDPQVASGVAFTIDDKGKIYVAEEYRFNQGTEENRTRAFFLDDDLQIQKLDDRLKMYEKWAHKFDGGMNWFRKHADQVRLLEDRDGDGKAEISTVFAGGFNDPLDGLAAGVLADERGIYFTCIPNLWLLKDKDGDGKADERTVMHTGFGVCCAFLGHDLHGLTWGPDGKLYFSVGDRGFHVVTREGKTLHGPRVGGVFRCDPDGANLELVMRGLRNPQELAFDQFGNLFADDNNCDKGDHARLVYVVEGGDAGWNMAYQTIPDPYLTGPWHAERMWHLPNPGQPAWITPTVGKIETGPSGFTFSSGVGWPERYQNRFFMADYSGNPGIESWGVAPKGAGFEITDYHDFLKPVRATDVDFGPDGKMYVLDFVDLNWNGGTAGGRVFAVTPPNLAKDSRVAETKELFAKGFKNRPLDELAKLLSHADHRVRQRAQFALADRAAVAEFVQATKGPSLFARIHAIWGLGQIARKQPDVLRAVSDLLSDADPEIRAQAAKITGDHPFAPAEAKLIELLADASPRVRYFAAMGLGKLKSTKAIGPIFAMIAEAKDGDPFLRHAGVTALERIDDRDAVQARAKDASAAVRLAVLLAQRRWADPRIAQFIADADVFIVTEAARAIHDVPIPEGYSALMKVIDRFAKEPTAGELDPLIRRALDLHFYVGNPDSARAVAKAITVPHFSPAVRAEAVACLRDWATPGQRDRVTGFWRTMPATRGTAEPRAVVEEAMTDLLEKTSGSLQTDVVNLISKVGAEVDEKQFLGWVRDEAKNVRLRGASLRLLAARKSASLNDALAVGLKDSQPLLRSESRAVLAGIDPARALAECRLVVGDDKAALAERQRAFETLARINDPKAVETLAEWGTKLLAGGVAPELRVDVLEAVRVKKPEVAKQFDDRIPRGDPIAKYAVSLTGGDAERGREIFVGHVTAQCIRCHAVNGQGGTAGPDLSKVASRYPEKTREHFLESMLLPNAKLAQGFAAVTLNLADGRVVGGTVAAEDAKSLTIQTPDGKKVVVVKDNIEERTAAPSAMPTVDRALTASEVRDLVEYLTSLK